METEVLAPAGSLEGLKAALYAGADAVYTGGRMFGARAYANNLTDEELLACMDYCHLHNKKLYLTTNTLIKEKELSELTKWLVPFYEHGLDAVIVQDLGALSHLKKEFPQLDLHVSTQMSVHSVESARMLGQSGAVRVVPARELTLSEIAAIRQNTSLEIECFVHGALCYSYSGQCLMSSMIGGRSGNRGRCAQPCRLPYTYDGKKEQFWLSPKDICTLEILPEILEAGVDSLKIEGRMKRTEYAAGVAAMYRKYVDLYKKYGKEGYRVEKRDLQELMDLYNRGGFSTGYYQRFNGVSMMSVKRQNHYGTEGAVLLESKKGGQAVFRALEDLYEGDMLESAPISANVKKGKTFSLKLRDKSQLKNGTIWNRTYRAPLMKQLSEDYTGKMLYEKIKGKLKIYRDEPVILTVTYSAADGVHSLTVESAAAQKAEKQPITEERVRKQMLRTGNTPYVFEKIEIDMEEDCFLPMQQLNELRREALDKVQKEQLVFYNRKFSGVMQKDSSKKVQKPETVGIQLSVSAEECSQLEKIINKKEIARIYLDSKCFPYYEGVEKIKNYSLICKEKGKELWYIFPSLFREKDRTLWEQHMKEWLPYLDGLLVKNLEQISYLQEIGYQGKFACDYNVYTYNQEAKAFLKNQGSVFTVCPAELNFRELKERGCEGDELLIYGKIPVMTSAQCLQKTAGCCNKTPKTYFLKDRMGKRFPVKNCCTQCYNVIYNAVPISLHGMEKEVSRLGAAFVRLAFTTETKEEAARITEGFVQEYIRKEEHFEADYEFTRGHYKRGVE